MKKGIDVSFAQGNINWGNVNTDFAIIRAGYGREASQKDSQFENNYAGCKSNSIPVGAYWYSYAMSESEAVQEYKACLEVIKGKTFEYPVYFDIEEPEQLALGKAKCTAIAKAFLSTVESAGYWVGIYSSKSSLENYISEDLRKRYAVWVAHYTDKTDYSGTYGMWQHSSSGKVNGINGNVDLNYCYADYPSAIKAKGLNGFKKPSAAKALDTDGYKKGSDTIGVLAMKELLLIAKRLGINKYGMDKNDVFGTGTQNAVNYLLGRWGYKQNGIAGKNFIKRLHTEIENRIK